VSSWPEGPIATIMATMSSVSPAHVRFGKRIRELRVAKGLTQEMLAAKIGVDRSYMGFLERGERNPSLEVILKIAKVLGVDSGDLLKQIR
jgi:transcriptional regulator with XRE-family HTH domain